MFTFFTKLFIHKRRDIICFLLFLTLPLVIQNAFGSESDVWTYSEVKLADAAPQINAQLKYLISEGIRNVNGQIKDIKNASGSSLEYEFSKFYDSKRDVPWLSHFEGCIAENNCPFGLIDRIVLKPGESVYAKSDYNEVTKSQLAPIIQLCGVRMGADKLTHMFEDGFRLYNIWMDKNRNLTDAELISISLSEENHTMGKTLTGINSWGDIYANLAGIRFFRDLFINGKLMGRKENGELFLKKDVDICKYIKPQFDERVSRVTFYEDNAKLLQTIINDKAKNPDKISPLQAEQVLCRKEDSTISISIFILAFTKQMVHPLKTIKFLENFPRSITEPDKRRQVENMLNGPDFSEAEINNFKESCKENSGSDQKCNCLIENFKKNFSFDEFMSLDTKIPFNTLTQREQKIISDVKNLCH
ncbi:MAG: hypothetical protein ACXVCP_12640 [Bdellovibrio sp.]